MLINLALFWFEWAFNAGSFESENMSERDYGNWIEYNDWYKNKIEGETTWSAKGMMRINKGVESL